MGRKAHRVTVAAVIPLALLCLSGWGIWGLHHHVDLIPTSMTATFLMGVAANVYVFIFVGIAGIIFTQLPHQDSLEQRLEYLFPKLSNSDDYREEVKRQVLHKLSAFGEQANLEIEVREHDPDAEAVKMFVKFDISYRNILERETHRDKRFLVEIEADPVALEPRGCLQDVQYMRNGDISSFEGCSGINIPNGQTTISRELDFQIPPNESMRLIYTYWIWAKRGTPYAQAVNRFTEQINLTLKNETDEDLCLEPVSDHLGSRGDAINLRSGESRHICLDSILPESGQSFPIQR